MALVTCENVSFAYEGNVVIKELNFQVQRGDYLCIIGENGSGKSTLMKGILGLNKPHQGILSWGEGLRAAEIGYLPQQTVVQKDFPASVYEVVLSGRLSKRGIRPFYTRTDREIVNENLNRMGLAKIKDACYRELSGGQQQRVLLGRALCATEKILLLDEPASGLDPLVTQELYNMIGMINKNYGITVIMISHDMHGVTHYASHILHLKNRQMFFGSSDEYLKTPIAQRFMGGDEGD